MNSNNHGVFVAGGTASIGSSTVSGNTAESGGGIWNGLAATLTVNNNTTIAGNTSNQNGGGLYNFGNATVEYERPYIITNAPSVKLWMV